MPEPQSQGKKKNTENALSSPAVAVVIVSPKEEITFINKNAKELLKEHFGKEFSSGNSIHDIIPRKKSTEFNTLLRKCFQEGPGKNFSLKTDSENFIGLSFAPQIDPTGKISSIAIFLTTEDYAEKFEDSAGKFRSIFENTPLGIFFTQPDGNILDCNRSGSEMFGYSLKEFQQLGRDTLFKQNEQLKKVLAERKKTGFVAGELTGIKKNGTIFPVEVYSSIFPSGDGTKYTSTVLIDISETRQKEIEFKEQTQIFESLFNEHPDAVYSFDLNGNFTTVNKSALDLAEISKEEILKLSFRSFYRRA